MGAFGDRASVSFLCFSFSSFTYRFFFGCKSDGGRGFNVIGSFGRCIRLDDWTLSDRPGCGHGRGTRGRGVPKSEMPVLVG